jgi:hypothetical protein
MRAKRRSTTTLSCEGFGFSNHRHFPFSGTSDGFQGKPVTFRILSIPRNRLSQEKDQAAGPDAPGSATCVLGSCHRGVFTCPNQKTTGFVAWLLAESQGFTPTDGNSESPDYN